MFAIVRRFTNTQAGAPQNVVGMSEFSEWLTSEVERRGLSLRDLASDIHQIKVDTWAVGLEGKEAENVRRGPEFTTIKSWMDGYVVPGWHNVGALADALGVSREMVRRMAGYADPDTGTLTEDVEVTEILRAWEQLVDFDRQALLRFVRALRDSPTRRG